jgi:GABA permease
MNSGLKRRHITMISMGGVIGAGLFVGSGQVIHEAGPGAVLGYLAVGLLVIVIMRMLAEMASARPTLGSFADYARSSLGEWAGFSTGWLYIYQWITAIAVEAVAAAAIAKMWLPGVLIWAIALTLLVVLTFANLVSARLFGEVETWLSSIKVATIVVFIFVGIAALVGDLGSAKETAGSVAHGGEMFPKGIGAVLSTIPIVIVAFYGSEVATIAAAESNEPKANIARTTNTVIIRIMLFYVLSLLLVVLLLPWHDSGAMATPFASTFKVIGIPGAELAMNIVVLTALISCLNSGIYASSRMVFALASKKDAPKALKKISRRGVPARSVLLVTAGGYLAVAMIPIFSQQAVFFFLINSAGAVAIVVYLVIAFSHLKMRRELDRDPTTQDRMKMPFFPVLSYIAIAAMIAVFFGMALKSHTQPQLLLTLATVSVVLSAYGIRKLRRQRRARASRISSSTDLLWDRPLTADLLPTDPIHTNTAGLAGALTTTTLTEPGSVVHAGAHSTTAGVVAPPSLTPPSFDELFTERQEEASQ